MHATLVDSQLRTYALLVGPLTADDEDRYCAETAQVGPLLGAPSDALPATRADLDAYLATMEQGDCLTVGETARALAEALLAPPGRRWVAPALWLGRLVTVGLLPPAVRAAYGFTWSARQARVLRASAAALRAARRVTPPVLWKWPAALGGPRRRARDA